MADMQPEIAIIDEPIDPQLLARLAAAWFGDMVKIVVDVRRQVVAVGGELHADAEHLLLEQESQQVDLWGANYYPGQGPDDCIEYTALINIRPAQNNPSMEVLEPEIRDRMRDLILRLIGRGEEL